jgi:hypothetical protein
MEVPSVFGYIVVLVLRFHYPALLRDLDPLFEDPEESGKKIEPGKEKEEEEEDWDGKRMIHSEGAQRRKVVIVEGDLEREVRKRIEKKKEREGRDKEEGEERQEKKEGKGKEREEGGEEEEEDISWKPRLFYLQTLPLTKALAFHKIVFRHFFRTILDIPIFLLALLSIWRLPKLIARVQEPVCMGGEGRERREKGRRRERVVEKGGRIGMKEG